MKLDALGPWWDQGKRLWGERSPREQLLLGGLAALAMVALLLVLIIRPLASERARAAADIRSYELLAMRLRAAAPGLAATGAEKGPPAAIVSRNAAALGLTVERVEPESGRLRVAFADAPFEAVVRFVATIEQTSNLRVSEARVDRSSNGSGGVSASFLFTT